jgi:hypothetical protein
VLRPRGKFIIFTALPEQMENYWLQHYFPEMMHRTIKQVPSLKLITQAMHHTGFKLVGSEKYFVQENLKDLFLYSGKNHPAIYLDGDVRNGISSFSSFCTKVEADIGLRNLAHDLANGEFSSVRKKYKDDQGDYIFLVLEKIK